jgi:hypothetical protein
MQVFSTSQFAPGREHRGEKKKRRRRERRERERKRKTGGKPTSPSRFASAGGCPVSTVVGEARVGAFPVH